MKVPRSIVFYAWLGLGAEALLAAGVVVFVFVGASYQSSAIAALHLRAKGAELANVELRAEFLDSQRALRGYQATRQNRFLETYYVDRGLFAVRLGQLRKTAWKAVLPGVMAQARTAEAAFQAGDRAVALPAGAARQTAALFATAAARSDTFVRRSNDLQDQLARQSNVLAAQSGRTLGVGLSATSTILVLGLMIPMLGMAVALLWTSRPLHSVTTMVRRRALGDTVIRVAPGGPADVRDLATSINFLADESDRLQAVEDERARLQDAVRQASTRIRKHLRAADVIKEAVAAVEEYLRTDFAWVGMVSGEDLRYAGGDQEVLDQALRIAGQLPRDSVGWMRELYRQRSSYCVQDLTSPAAAEIPAPIREILLGMGAVSLMLAPFGAGSDLLGMITMVRNDPGMPWTTAETGAAELLAADVGRALEHARLYEGEQRLVTELQSLDRAKTSFLASSSHDLRTPLTSILGYAEILADSDVARSDPEQAKMLDAVSRNVRRLQILIEDMLTISNIEMGNFTSALRPVDLASLVPSAADVIRPSAEEKDLAFAVDCPEHGLMVDGDPEQLDRVLVNLLSNAVKYTPAHGSVRLTAVRQEDCAVLTVADTGIGIPEKEQDSLFTRFFRASNAVAGQVPGSGLGLNIVQTVVSNHGGKIGLTSAEGRGTTVTVRIPLLDGDGAVHAGPRRAHSAAGQRPARNAAGPSLAGPARPIRQTGA